ncbi:MAG: secretin N-terminal domain-containing protein, partial [Rickettsiales bacterium]
MQKTLKISVIPLCVAAFIGVSGCAKMQSTDIFNAEKYDHIDKQQKLSRDDYRHMTRPEPKDGKYMPYVEGDPELKVELGEPPVPDISNILAAPRPPKLGETQLIDIFVTEQASLKDTLIELGRIANVDVEIDPSIQGGIVFRAQKRPFNEVIERISSLAGLRYSMENGVLRIERDTPYVETYPLDFLSYSRSSSSEVSVSTSVLSAGGEASGGDGLDTGASSTISYEMEGDFWEQFEATVESILQYAPTTGLSVQSGIDDIPDGQSFFTINRQAGALTVSGTERQQRMVENYIKTMR